MYDAEAIHRSLSARLSLVYVAETMRRTLRDLATDLVGATDPADLPAECRVWVEQAIDDAAETTAGAATERMLAELTMRLAAAPHDLGHCELMQAVAHAQAIHVTEVR